jgi:hypothetical protein
MERIMGCDVLEEKRVIFSSIIDFFETRVAPSKKPAFALHSPMLQGTATV